MVSPSTRKATIFIFFVKPRKCHNRPAAFSRFLQELFNIICTLLFFAKSSRPLDMASSSGGGVGEGEGEMCGEAETSCVAEEMADAKLLTRSEALGVIESLTLDFLRAIARGEDPEMFLVRPYIASHRI